MRLSLAFLMLAVGFGRCAINIDGSQAVEPADADEKDPSPIGDPKAYEVDQHDCPLACSDYSNTHSWIPYLSVERLRRCKEPMLLQFSITQPLDDPNSNILIRSCTLGSHADTGAATLKPVENPKKDEDLVQGGSLEVAPACAVVGTEVSSKMDLLISPGGTGDSQQITGLLDGMQKYFSATDNCDENFLFAYHRQTVASIYIGAGLGKPSVNSALKALTGRLRSDVMVANQTVVQLCSEERHPERIFGMSIDTTGDLAAVQKTDLDWSVGQCVSRENLRPASDLASIRVFDIAGINNSTRNGTITGSTNSTSITARMTSHLRNHLASRFRGASMAGQPSLDKRATCRYIKVQSGDGCASLASRCAISGADFTKYNTKKDFCSTLREGDYACCSSGTPFTPPKPIAPKPGTDGICATHLIGNGDSCDKLATSNGITVADIEKWNKGKTWAWTECKDMLVGYNMCLSSGKSPLPPPQQGAECGPLVPGTKMPTDSSISIADLNPCPLKACCSNWGFCGVFPAHCDVHMPDGGGPGTKIKGYQNTCVSNCGNKIKQNSATPAKFQRIGYYESFGMERDCLWLKAKNANTDGSYTHIHWAFADIDPKTWKPIIKDKKNQWSDFKKLTGVKRIVSFGGWAYSTELATYNIIRSAIITNRQAFVNNLVQFVKDEGIDGIDIDWEYPGAPDILVNGSPIGKKSDGIDYWMFLLLLKTSLPSGKTVSIAAPASYWYLKAFPIDRIASTIDYIVYMTYDLHGQWGYGNANAYDSCPSGKCIRSHVNMTETENALSMITKAGVANSKIFVGEASYGRSFRMAKDGCWGPMCDYTGSRTESNANPGRCTKTKGYLAYAEITELIQRGQNVKQFYDSNSDSDILLHKGDYVSYMTPATKDTRREKWKGLNFGGSIDWAVDLQSFTTDDMDAPPDRPKTGQGCVGGEDRTIDSGDLHRIHATPPPKDSSIEARAFDENNVDLNRLCKFACQYGYCPNDVCTTGDEPYQIGDDPNAFNYTDAKWENQQHCQIFKDPKYRDTSINQCYPICKPVIDQARDEDGDAITNVGCVGSYPLNGGIPWQKYPGSSMIVAPGQCVCNNWLVNELAEFVMDAMPIIAQIGCYILMSALKLVLDVGLAWVPGPGKAIDAGLDMALTAAETANYIYNKAEDPSGSFSFWFSPCGGSDLVPDDIKRVFNILSGAPSGVSSFKTPKKLKKGSGKKGDDGNPRGVVKRPTTGGANGKVPSRSGNGKCRVPPSKQTQRMGVAKNTMRVMSCDRNAKTKTTEVIITSVNYAAGAKPTQVVKECSKAWSQACFHYSSAIRYNSQWSTLACPPEAATTAHRLDGHATDVWTAQHTGTGWTDPNNRAMKKCDRDEYPPAYLLGNNDPAYLLSGVSARGQSVRFLPATENRKAGQMWKGVCFANPVKGLSDSVFMSKVSRAPSSKKKKTVMNGGQLEQTFVEVDIEIRPQFSIKWGHSASPPKSDGLYDNSCWPKGLAAADPGFTLLTYDPFYSGKAPPYDYKKPYVKGSNGS